MMRHPFKIFAVLAMVFAAAPALAQSAADSAAATKPAPRPPGAYDLLSEGDKKIVSAIYEAQLGSAKDTGWGSLLTRDDIAAMRQKNGWGNAYHQLYAKGMVTEKNLGQAIAIYNHSTQASRPITVINTGNGDQLAFSKDKRDNAPSPSAKPAAAKAAPAKPAPVKPAAVKPDTGGAAGATAPGVVLNGTTPAGNAARVSVNLTGTGNGGGNAQAGGVVLK